MTIDSFVIRLAIFIVPGYIGYLLFNKLRSNSHSDIKKHQWTVVFNIFVFTVISYLIFDYIQILISKIDKKIRNPVFERLLDRSDVFNNNEIISLIVISSFFGIVLAIFENRNLITKLFNLCKVTNVSTREDVWSYCVKNRHFEWVMFRDFNNSLIYYGHIDKYSLTDNKREILLIDVDVYSMEDSEHLFNCDSMYISRNDCDFNLEVNSNAVIKETENDKGKRNKSTTKTK